MAINIQNLIDAVNAKIQASPSISELIKLQRALNEMTSASGTPTYGSIKELPLADSANAGEFVYVTDSKIDRYGSFYISNGSNWNRFDLTKDSDEDILVTGYNNYHTFQGTNYGYTAGGAPVKLTIDKFPFASNGGSFFVGNLSVARFGGSSQSSATDGYYSGGTTPATSRIDSWPFASDTNATWVGGLQSNNYYSAGQSSQTHGYSSGGFAAIASIERFPFALDEVTRYIANMIYPGLGRRDHSGQSSREYGYMTASRGPLAVDSVKIEKFPFAIEVGSSAVGVLTVNRYSSSGQSSNTHGYTAGGTNNVIDKFSFASDANATIVGQLVSTAFSETAGQSSVNHGYASGPLNTIQSFPFASDTNATAVGTLTQSRTIAGGNQY